MNSKLGDCALLAQLKHLGIAQHVHRCHIRLVGQPFTLSHTAKKMAVQGRKRAALFSWKRSFTLMKSCGCSLAVSELPAPDQPRQGSPHREAYGER
jgi:hypothetical protein